VATVARARRPGQVRRRGWSGCPIRRGWGGAVDLCL